MTEYYGQHDCVLADFELVNIVIPLATYWISGINEPMSKYDIITSIANLVLSQNNVLTMLLMLALPLQLLIWYTLIMKILWVGTLNNEQAHQHYITYRHTSIYLWCSRLQNLSFVDCDCMNISRTKLRRSWSVWDLGHWGAMPTLNHWRYTLWGSR